MLLTILITAIIIFILGIVITKWLAGKKDWSDSWGPAILVNIVWLIVIIGVSVALSYANLDQWVSTILSLVINLILGAIIVAKVYDKGFGSSLLFVIIILIILFILMIVIMIIVAIIILSILLG